MQSIDRDQMYTLASPFPYVLASVQTADGQANAIGLGWWMFTSWDPIHLAISVGHGKYSYKCLEEVPEFVLCFPAEDQARGAWICGKKSGHDGDKMAQTGFELIPSLEVTPPTIAGSTVALECKVEQTIDTGDHRLYTGPVVAMRGDPERAFHLYTIHYKKLLALSSEGGVHWKVGRDD